MIYLKAVYRIPQIKHVFFIMSFSDEVLDNSMLSLQNKKRREYFEHILQSKHHIKPIEAQQWRLKTMLESDLVKAIEHYTPKELESSNPSYSDPESLELLTINLLKKEYPEDDFYHTYKGLGRIQNEDIIEVFV